MEQLKRLIQEIHRRNLWQVLIGYLAASFAILEGVDLLIERLDLPESFFPFAFLLIVVGLPVVLFTALVQSSERLGRRTQQRASDRPVSEGSSPTVRRLFTWRNTISGGVLALALWGVVATGWYLLYGGAVAEETSVAHKSVAVLPFDDLSPDRENEYFCTG